jgi:hypothetical protein
MISYNLDNQKDRRNKMVEKIEDVDGPGENTLLQHDQFLYNMGHGPEGCQQHENGEENQKRVRYLIQK